MNKSHHFQGKCLFSLVTQVRISASVIPSFSSKRELAARLDRLPAAQLRTPTMAVPRAADGPAHPRAPLRSLSVVR
jgi:hypothetical protein